MEDIVIIVVRGYMIGVDIAHDCETHPLIGGHIDHSCKELHDWRVDRS